MLTNSRQTPVIIFLGDSITDCGHLWQPESQNLGDGYVSMLSQMCEKNGQPAILLNKGYDGYTLPALFRSLERDCLSKNPDFISILIGINDIGISQNTGQTLLDQHFAEEYGRLLSLLRSETHARLLCLGPFIFPHPQKYARWIPDVLQAEDSIRFYTERFQIPFLPLQEKMNNLAEANGYSAITTDGIHLTAAGHHFLAQQIYPFLSCLSDGHS